MPFFLVPRIAEAATLAEIMVKVNKYIINPAILLLFAVALVVFVFGIIEFLAQRDTDSEAGLKGKRHMMWGVIGMFIMVSVFAIMHIIINTLGVTLPSGVDIP